MGFEVKVICTDAQMLSHIIYQVSEAGASVAGVTTTADPPPPPAPPAPPLSRRGWKPEDDAVLRETMELFPAPESWAERSLDMDAILERHPGRTRGSLVSRRYRILAEPEKVEGHED